MQRNTLETVSVWQESTPPIHADLQPREQCEVCVVGAGIAGLTAAFLMRQEGRDVQVIDAFEVGAGETGRTTAHLTAVLDDRFVELIKLFGTDGARLAAQSHASAIDQIARIVKEAEIDCDFERVDGVLFCSKPDQADLLHSEAKAAAQAGFTDLVAMERLSIGDVRVDGPALFFPRQAMFHAGRYLQGLARVFLARGGHIATGVQAVAVEEENGMARVVLDNGREIRARHVVVATNTPINDRVTMHTKQAAVPHVRGRLRAFRAAAFPHVLLWDTGRSVSLRARAAQHGDGSDVLIVGGEDHKTGQADDADSALRARSSVDARALPDAAAMSTYRWSGQVMEPVDGLAFIGRNPGDDETSTSSTGDSGNGMTHGTIAGMLLTDLDRRPRESLGGALRPGAQDAAARREYREGERSTSPRSTRTGSRRGDVDDAAKIAPGDGRVIVRGGCQGRRLSRRRGALHERSAVCPHLGCIVRGTGREDAGTARAMARASRRTARCSTGRRPNHSRGTIRATTNPSPPGPRPSATVSFPWFRSRFGGRVFARRHESKADGERRVHGKQRFARELGFEAGTQSFRCQLEVDHVCDGGGDGGRPRRSGKSVAPSAGREIVHATSPSPWRSRDG